MSTPAIITLEGPLTVRTVAEHFRHPLPQDAPEWTVDLAAVSEVDSSALALLLAWLRRAKAQGARLEVRAAPAALLTLARLYGIEGLVPTAL